jgi:hypothetical protein
MTVIARWRGAWTKRQFKSKSALENYIFTAPTILWTMHLSRPISPLIHRRRACFEKGAARTFHMGAKSPCSTFCR